MGTAFRTRVAEGQRSPGAFFFAWPAATRRIQPRPTHVKPDPGESGRSIWIPRCESVKSSRGKLLVDARNSMSSTSVLSEDVASRKNELRAGTIGPAGMTGYTSSHFHYLSLFNDHALEHFQNVDMINGRIIAAELMDCLRGSEILVGSAHG